MLKLVQYSERRGGFGRVRTKLSFESFACMYM